MDELKKIQAEADALHEQIQALALQHAAKVAELQAAHKAFIASQTK